jgi:hypothetical protein
MDVQPVLELLVLMAVRLLSVTQVTLLPRVRAGVPLDSAAVEVVLQATPIAPRVVLQGTVRAVVLHQVNV